VACNLGIEGVPTISSIDSDCGRSDENGADHTFGSLACMGVGLVWWEGGMRTDQEVSKIRWMLKNKLRFGGDY